MSATHDNTFWPAGDGGRYHGIVPGLNFQFSKVRPKFVCMIQEPGTDAPVSVRFHNRAILRPSGAFFIFRTYNLPVFRFNALKSSQMAFYGFVAVRVPDGRPVDVVNPSPWFVHG